MAALNTVLDFFERLVKGLLLTGAALALILTTPSFESGVWGVVVAATVATVCSYMHMNRTLARIDEAARAARAAREARAYLIDEAVRAAQPDIHALVVICWDNVAELTCYICHNVTEELARYSGSKCLPHRDNACPECLTEWFYQQVLNRRPSKCPICKEEVGKRNAPAR